MGGTATSAAVTIRALSAEDVDRADHIMRLAFGTFLGLPEPASFAGDADYVHTRFAADPTAAFAAELDGRLIGSSFAARWGSLGVLGPLTVDPEHWDCGIGSRLMETTMERFADWGVRHVGLFTFAHSPKHACLYQKFGFWPRFLTAIMARPVAAEGAPLRPIRLSALDSRARDEALVMARELTASLYEGLDLTREVEQLAHQGLGHTLLLDDERGIAGVAVCHCGPGSEAGSGTCYVKFAAVRPGPNAAELFERLIESCEGLVRDEKLDRIVAGANVARFDSYRILQRRGYRTWLQGVAMDRPNEPGYNTDRVYAIDDWR